MMAHAMRTVMPARGMAMTALGVMVGLMAMMSASVLFAVKRLRLNGRREGNDGYGTQNKCGETQWQAERNTWKHNPSWFGNPRSPPVPPLGDGYGGLKPWRMWPENDGWHEYRAVFRAFPTGLSSPDRKINVNPVT
jgi:hypothetical protein